MNSLHFFEQYESAVDRATGIQSERLAIKVWYGSPYDVTVTVPGPVTRQGPRGAAWWKNDGPTGFTWCVCGRLPE